MKGLGVALVSLLIVSAVLCSPVAGETISYWRLEGDLTDSVGDNDLQAGSESNYGWNESGLYGSDVPLTDASNNDAVVLDGDSLSVSGSGGVWTPSTFTIECFVNPTAPSTGPTTQHLAGVWDATNQSWALDMSNGAPRLRVRDIDNTEIAVTADQALTSGETYAVAGMLSDSELSLYSRQLGDDAYSLLGSASLSAWDGLETLDDSLYIGDKPGWSGDTDYGGVMDEVRFSSGALGEAELLATPEPTTTCLAIAAAAAGVFAVWRKKRKAASQEEAA